MSKAVLISIRPEWCEKIASGKKTIEVRKSRPKIETPFRCYIYCTKPKKYSSDVSLYTDELYRLPSGEIKYGSSVELSSFPDQWNKDNFLSGKIIGEFICDRIVKAECGQYCRLLSTLYTQIPPQELFNYANYKPVYGWHISDLLIYDKPKELSEFHKPGCSSPEDLDEDLCKYCYETDYGEKKCYSTPYGPVMCEGDYCDSAYDAYLEDEGFTLTRPPQSWCYVEEIE